MRTRRVLQGTIPAIVLGLLLASNRAAAAPCEAVPHLPVATIDATAQQVVLEVTAAGDCDWQLNAWAPFTLPARRAWWGPRQVLVDVTANPGLVARTAVFSIRGHDVRLVQAAGTDRDGDGLSDEWERFWDLPVGATPGAEGLDPDGDGVPTREEADAGTHPRAQPHDSFWFAEGISTPLLLTTYAFVSLAPEPVTLVVTFLGRDGVLARWPLHLRAQWPVYLDAARFAALDDREFAVSVEASAGQVVAERIVTVTGGGQQAAPATYARHAGASTHWYLAEGTTLAGFQLFYVLANPGPETAEVDVTYVFPGGRPPLTRPRRLAPFTRDVIWVNHEAEGLDGTDVAAHLHSDHPIVVERTQFLQRPGGWTAAAAAAAQPAPATQWVFAEGATGPVFDTFFAFLNPSDTPTTVTATYVTALAQSFVRAYHLPPRSRTTVRVDDDPALAEAEFSTRVVADGPVVVERMMWWPGGFPTWYEGHTSPGQTPASVEEKLLLAAPLVELGPEADSVVLSWAPRVVYSAWDVRCENGARADPVFFPVSAARATNWLSDLKAHRPALAGRCALIVHFGVGPFTCAPEEEICLTNITFELATYGPVEGRLFGRGTVHMLQRVEP